MESSTHSFAEADLPGRSLTVPRDLVAAMPPRAPTVLAAVTLALWTLLRLGLWFLFGREAGLALATLPQILAVGALRDLSVVTLLLALALLWTVLFPGRFRRSVIGRTIGQGLVFCYLFGLLYLSVVEYFYFAEFSSRFDLVAVDYLIYPTEVLINLWESYPVAWVLGVCALLAGVAMRLLAPKLGDGPIRPFGLRLQGLAIWGMVGIVSWAGAGRLSLSADHRVAEQLAENGLRTFFRAFSTSEIDYAAYYRTGDPGRNLILVRDWLSASGRAPVTAAPHAGLMRRFPGSETPPEKLPNIVLVLEESFGAEFVGAYGDDRGLTPEFDALAKESLLFRRAYATGTRTVRGIEAVMTSFPPIPTESIVKRPGSEGIATLGGVLEQLGYRTMFLYGGYSYFDNMKHFFASNGFEVRDRSNFPEPSFANIWGVSDEDLFRASVATLDGLAAEEAPFFAVVLSTSNHKPFTFPSGVPGVAEEGGGRLAGIRYADHAIGRFFDEARTRPWAQETMFVVLADHGARVYGAAKIPLESYEIPFLIHWPDHLEPGVVDDLTSQLDVAPTLLGLLGRPYEAPFFGRDVLASAPGDSPTLLFNHDHDVALVKDGQIVVLGLGQSADQYRLRPGPGEDDPMALQAALCNLTVAVYQTADRLFHNHTYVLPGE